MNRRNMFDRIALYRWAAAILSITVIRSIWTLVADTMPWTPWRVVLWTGYAVLMFAVVRDAWSVYQARKGIHKSLRQMTEKV